ncbi:hypothetical protein [Polaromonas sp. CG_23.6]|uniref:hypothetical protein n=1 Tax=Polaromonas sp. CG_23.6 TaxID=2760709 RepID=UPI002473C124|nr:hypothetical protein [Polaromonas sp. CG_23.6]MDH6185505.1 hypothetical protein [Polaromonas sp. CG_23.6]
MRVKLLFEDLFQIVAVMDGNDCPADAFINDGEDNLKARVGLQYMLGHVAQRGLADIPSGWVHEANKNEKIYEFIKGDLRLFFFKGERNQIAVCTAGVLKKGQKADKAAVAKAAIFRKTYIAAAAANTIEVIHDEDE